MQCAEKSYSIAEVKGKRVAVRSPRVSKGLIRNLALPDGRASDTIAKKTTANITNR